MRALEYGMLTASGCGLGRRPPDDDPQRLEDPARRDPLPRRCAEKPPADATARSERRRAQQAAVDRDHGAGDVGGALGAEEGDEVAVLLGPAEAAGRDFGPARPLRRRSSEPPASARRSVAKRPVATVLTVIPSPATSRDERLEEADRGHPVGVGEVEAGDRLAGRAWSRR